MRLLHENFTENSYLCVSKDSRNPLAKNHQACCDLNQDFKS